MFLRHFRTLQYKKFIEIKKKELKHFTINY